ncbi:MAG: hypothetical protein EOP11_22535 [Proteobacteria bacterium]|nr:MAG: hypothetical protein EOP11_22535 [Pseudomonadota bacterium]
MKTVACLALCSAISSIAMADYLAPSVPPHAVIAAAGLSAIKCEIYVQNLNSFRPEATKPELFSKATYLVRDEAEAIQKSFAGYDVKISGESGEVTIKEGPAHYRVTSLKCEASK